MPLTQAQILAAQAVQYAAAHDQAQQVRLVAGPGTGKSSAIEERVRWLLTQGVQPASIYAVSFTRASALDLRLRVHDYCTQNGYPAASQVRVTTLHSLALRTLRAAGLLTAYPADPLVLDSWELENVFDAEFGHASGIGKKRRENIRLEHEAFWSTGQWGPPNYVPPNPPISPAERQQFTTFHGPRTQSYS
jgi:DNA helicase II / ATP-dependent DNA helicase PcrA